MYNGSILKILSEQNKNIIAFSDKKAFGKYIEMSNIHIPIKNIPIWIFGMSNNFFLFLNYIWSSLLNVLILVFSKSDDVLVYVFNNSFSSNLLNTINCRMKRNVIICCHGELELLSPKEGDTTHIGLLAKLLRKKIKLLFHSSNYSLSFIVAGDILKKNLLSIIGDTDLKIYSIDHPYIFDKQVTKKRYSKDRILHLGTVGTLSKNKGGDDYINLIRECSASYIDFYAIGGASAYSVQLEKVGVKYPCKEYSFCPREVYDSFVRYMDFILFFYPSNSYQLTASGAVFDSLRNETPILALKNDYFSYLFEKFGCFGYLFDNTKEMSDFVNSGLLLSEHSFDFQKIKSKLEPHNFVDIFGKIIG